MHTRQRYFGKLEISAVTSTLLPSLTNSIRRRTRSGFWGPPDFASWFSMLSFCVIGERRDGTESEEGAPISTVIPFGTAARQIKLTRSVSNSFEKVAVTFLTKSC